MTTETTTTRQTYEAAMRAVLMVRRAKAIADSRVTALREAWEAAHAAILAEQTRLAAETASAEEAARMAALAESGHTDAKTLPYGAVVRTGERLVTDDAAKALDFARQHAPHCLALETKAWTKEATHLLDTRPALLAGIAHVEATRTVALPSTERLAAALAEAPQP